MKTWQIDRHTLENCNLRDVASDEMRHSSKETGEIIYLAIRENLSVVYISKIDSLKPIRAWNPIGGSAPLHCAGTRKAILDGDMALTLERGYSYDTGEFREGISVWALPAVCPSRKR